MSIFKTGYFIILPKELRKELNIYFYNYLDSLVILNTSVEIDMLIVEFGDDNTSFNLNNDSKLYFDIQIYLPPEYGSNIIFKFNIEFQQLYTFIETYINNITLDFIATNFVFDKNLTADKYDYKIKRIYENGQLRNLDENNCIDLYQNLENSLLGLGYFTQMGNDVMIKSLNQMQSEILVYKLYLFYRDLLTKDVANISEIY